MRITHEADYAVRIIFCLACSGKRLGAKEISNYSGVTLRFTSKILSKLLENEIVESYKGIKGGYILRKSPEELSLGEVIEIIDGPIKINHCLDNEFDCTRVKEKNKCDLHKAFDGINKELRGSLYNIKFNSMIKNNKNN